MESLYPVYSLSISDKKTSFIKENKMMMKMMKMVYGPLTLTVEKEL